MYQSALLTNVNAKRINQHTNTSRAAEVYEEPEFSYNDVLYDEMSRNVKRHKRNTSNNSRNGSANAATTLNTSSKISTFSNPLVGLSLGGTQSSSYMTSLSATNTSSNDLTKDDILNWVKKLIDEKTVVKGDANGDGKVDLNDLKVMVDRMFDDKVDIKMKNVDFDDDGKISLKDITKVIDILLEKGEPDDPVEPAPPPKQILKGDVNGDGKITQEDAKLISKYYVGDDVEIDMDNADIDDNGKITLADVSQVRQWANKFDPQILKGDANGDGIVNYKDVDALQRASINLGGKIDMEAADFDGDGEITSVDVAKTTKLANEYEAKFQKIIGDSNGDGVVNEKDYANVKNYINNVSSSDDFIKKNSDINGDGNIDSKDLQGIRDALDGFNINYNKTTLRGDVDGDGKVTKADAQLISDYNNRKATSKNFYINNADFNNDGKIDSKDVEAIEKALKPEHKINYSTGGHLGDIDGNGRIEISDAVFLNNFIKDNVNTEKEVFINNADVNKDGKVDINDVNAITDLLRNVKKAERLVPVYTNGQQNGDFIKTGDNFILLEQQGDSLKVQYTAADGNDKIGWVHESIFVPEPPPDPDPITIVDPPFTQGRATKESLVFDNFDLKNQVNSGEKVFANETFTVKAMSSDGKAYQIEYDSIYGYKKTRWIDAASVVENKSNIPEALQKLINQYEGKIWRDESYRAGSSQCKEFAAFIFDALHHTDYIGSTRSDNYRISINNKNKVGTRGETQFLTKYNVQSLFSNAKAGDFVQMKRSNSKGGPHSAIVGEITSEGVWFFEANAPDPDGRNYVYDKIKYQFHSWENLAAKNSSMSVYYAK